MIKIHSTKKLLAKLPLDDSGMLISQGQKPDERPSSESPLGNWHANVLTLQGCNCLLFVHDTTRFPVFIKGLDKYDFAELSWLFDDGFVNTLLKLGANNKKIQTAANALQALTFDNHCDRSVQGTMNRMAGDIEYMLKHDRASLEDISAYKTGAWVADQLCSEKGSKKYFRPKDAMFSLLDEITDGVEHDTDAQENEANFETSGHVVRIDGYRK